MNRFNKLTLNESDEMSIDLFHILKAFNVPRIIFDRIMNWVKRHEGNRITNGSNGLLKREKFINNLNQKLYNKIMIKPKVTLTHLSSRRDTKVVTSGFKEMILSMASNKSLFHLINLLLDPNNQ